MEYFEVSFVENFVMPLRFRVLQVRCPWMGDGICRISQLHLLSLQPFQFADQGHCIHVYLWLQEARFPQLRSLRPEQRARLKSSFIPTDDLSFLEWMRSLKLVPPDLR